MPVTVAVPVDTGELFVDTAEVSYRDETDELVVSLDRAYTGGFFSAPGLRIEAGGDTVASSSSIAFTSGLSASRRPLLEHGDPILLVIEDTIEVDITAAAAAVVPENAGPDVQVTTLAAFGGGGANTVEAGETAEIQVGLTNYGDTEGRRVVSVSFADETIGSVDAVVEAGETTGDYSIGVDVPEMDRDEVRLSAGAVTIPVAIV